MRGHPLLPDDVLGGRTLSWDHAGLLRVQLSVQVARLHLLLDQRLGLFAWRRRRSVAQRRQLVLGGSFVQKLLRLARCGVQRCHVGGFMALTEGAQLVGLGLVRDQLFAWVVPLVSLCLEVASTTALLDLPSD